MDGRGIDLRLSGNLGCSAGFAYTNTAGTGDAGNIYVTARRVYADDGTVLTPTGFNAVGLAGAAGNAGNVVVSANELTLDQAQDIDVTTDGSGRGGDVSIDSHRITLNGAGQAPFNTGVFAKSDGAGDAGDIRIQAGTLLVTSAASIDGSAHASGRGGDVSINANDVLIDGSATPNRSTGVYANSDAFKHSGPGGDITLKAATLKILGGGNNPIR
jgi:hypothetical protein